MEKKQQTHLSTPLPQLTDAAHTDPLTSTVHHILGGGVYLGGEKVEHFQQKSVLHLCSAVASLACRAISALNLPNSRAAE